MDMGLLKEPVGESHMFTKKHETGLPFLDEFSRYNKRGIRKIPFTNRERDISHILSINKNL